MHDLGLGGWRTAQPRIRQLGDFVECIRCVDAPGEAGAASEQEGWEKTRVQIDSGAIVIVGPRSVAKALQMKEAAMPKKGIEYVAANGASKETMERKGQLGTQTRAKDCLRRSTGQTCTKCLGVRIR